MVPNRSFKLFVALVLLVSATLTGGTASASPAARRGTLTDPTVAYQADFPIVANAGEYDLLNVVLDFAPGAGVPEHVHGGDVLVTVLEGEITLQEKGTERTVKTGESWTEKPGDLHAVINRSGANTRVAVNILLPKGAEATTVQGTPQNPPPGPTVVTQAQFPITVKAGEYDLLNVVLDFASGAGVPEHFHGGDVLVTVLEGEMILQEKGTERTVKTGESWTEKPGDVHAVVNQGGANTRVWVNVLLPRGAAVTTLVGQQPVTLPATGGDSTNSFNLWLMLITGAVLVASGWFLQKKVIRG